jgi:hypothetical protein
VKLAIGTGKGGGGPSGGPMRSSMDGALRTTTLGSVAGLSRAGGGADTAGPAFDAFDSFDTMGAPDVATDGDLAGGSTDLGFATTGGLASFLTGSATALIAGLAATLGLAFTTEGLATLALAFTTEGLATLALAASAFDLAGPLAELPLADLAVAFGLFAAAAFFFAGLREFVAWPIGDHANVCDAPLSNTTDRRCSSFL